MSELDQDRLENALRQLSELPRAHPPRQLLYRIEASLRPVGRTRLAVAAAVVLCLNLGALFYSLQGNEPDNNYQAGVVLISDYQLYE